MHHGRGEEQVLVVARVIQTALFGGQQAGEQKAPEAVIEDRLTLRGAGDRKTRIGERPGGSTRISFMAASVWTSREGQQWPEGRLPL